MKKTPQPLPLALVHVRITAVAANMDDTEPLRDAVRNALLSVVMAHADNYGLRVKRRIVSRKDGADLFKRYKARANMHEMIE